METSDQEQNSEMPRAAFKGATPEEIYLGNWSEKDEQILKEKTKLAAKARLAFNQSRKCAIC